MTTLGIILPYIYGSVSLFIIILLYIAFCVFRIKRRLWKELNNEEEQKKQYMQ